MSLSGQERKFEPVGRFVKKLVLPLGVVVLLMTLGVAVLFMVAGEPGKAGETVAAREKAASSLLIKAANLAHPRYVSDEQIALYDEVVRRFGNDKSPGVRAQVAEALLSKGSALMRRYKAEEAIAIYDEVVRRFGNDSTDVRIMVANALFGKSVALYSTSGAQYSKKAIAIYDEIDHRFGKDKSPLIREKVARAILYKGIHSESEEQIAVYDEVVRRFGNDDSPWVREHAAQALSAKSDILWSQGKTEEAIAIYEDIIRRFERDFDRDKFYSSAVARAKSYLKELKR